MALIAVRTVVHIIADSGVLGICLSGTVAIGAREDRVVVRIRVTVAARPVGAAVGVIHREISVIERCPRPRGGVVTGRARGREACRGMVRICRIVVVCRVAGVAIRRRVRKVIVDVTRRACERRVRSRQSESGRAVVERRSCPRSRGMASFTGGREPCRGMVRICGAVEVVLVTRNAGCRQVRELSVSVTRRTLQGRVCASQCESCRAVVERRSAPGCRGVTDGTVGWESGGQVIRVIGVVVVGLVT